MCDTYQATRCSHSPEHLHGPDAAGRPCRWHTDCSAEEQAERLCSPAQLLAAAALSRRLCAGIAIGGDVFPGSTLSDHCIRYQHIPAIKMIVVLGELGGQDEYSLVRAASTDAASGGFCHMRPAQSVHVWHRVPCQLILAIKLVLVGVVRSWTASASHPWCSADTSRCFWWRLCAHWRACTTGTWWLPCSTLWQTLLMEADKVVAAGGGAQDRADHQASGGLGVWHVRQAVQE